MRTLQCMAFMAAFGALFLTPRGAGQTTFTTLYRFQGSPDGATPQGGVAGANGVLYGTTRFGGTSGAGTVFKLQGPLGSGAAGETVLYSFTGGNDGGYPIASPVVGANGELYGTTANGGISGYGTVFELLPPAEPNGTWTETVLYSFKGGDDQFPNSSLVVGGHGELYGVALGDGEEFYGEVFELQPPSQPGGTWTETVPYSFNTGPLEIGAYPSGVIMGPAGVLYGTTYGGGLASGSGAVFELQPPGTPDQAWTVSDIYRFTGGADGGGPEAAPVVGPDGTLYGTTNYGGNTGWGTVFQLMPPSSPGGNWTETVLYNFANTGDGGKPSAPLVLNKGTIYGTASLWGQGVWFSSCRDRRHLAVPGQEIVLYTFPILNVDNSPYGSIVVDKAGTLYGATSYGPGPKGLGTVFRIEP